MHRIATPIWNQIAPLAEHPTWKHLFGLEAEAQADAQAAIAQDLRAKGTDPMVLLSYLELAPLLQERKAIREFVTSNPRWATALPEVLTTNEAILLATTDYRLKVSQTRALRKLLDAPPPQLQTA